MPSQVITLFIIHMKSLLGNTFQYLKIQKQGCQHTKEASNITAVVKLK